MDNNKGLIAKWSHFFITRYKVTIILLAAIVVAGLWGVFRNQRQDFPAISSNYVSIQATYIGASAEDVEQKVINPIEQEISNIANIKNLRSNSFQHGGYIFMEMKGSDGIDEVVDEAKSLAASVSVPAGVEVETSSYDVIGPALVYALSSEEKTTDEVLAYSDEVRSRLLGASTDIKNIDIYPDNEFEVRVEYNADKLEEQQVTAYAFTQAIQSALSSLPGGVITNQDDETLSITVSPAVTTLRGLRLFEVDGVALNDVATVERMPVDNDSLIYAGFLEDDKPISREAVYLFIYKKEDGDVIRIAEAITAELEQIEIDQVLSEDIAISSVYDNSRYVKQQISDLIRNGWFGLILILLVLMLFINFRTGFIVAFIIPLAFLATLGILFALGFTINILTLFGLLLVLGILVDNAIVIAEGIMYHIERGEMRLTAVLNTMMQLGPAVTVATLTTIVVFIPFAMIGGIVGEFLRYIPYTIIIMLVVSYFLAITITPLLSRYLMKNETREQRRSKKLSLAQKVFVLPLFIHFGQKSVDLLEDLYGDFSKWVHQTMFRKLMIVFLALAFIGGSTGYFLPKLAIEQFPQVDAEAMTLNVNFPANVGVEAQKRMIAEVMEEAVTVEYFKSYYIFEGQIIMIFAEAADRAKGDDIYVIQEELDNKLQQVRNSLEVNDVKISTAILGVGPPLEEYDVVVELRDDSFSNLDLAAADLVEYINKQEGVVEVTNSAVDQLVDSVDVKLHEDKLREYSIDPLTAAGVVSSVFGEQSVGKIVVDKNGVSDKVVVSYSDDSYSEIEEIEKVVVGMKQVEQVAQQGSLPYSQSLSAPLLEPVYLADVATVEQVVKPKAIRHLNQKRIAEVKVRVDDGVDGAALESDIHEYLDEGLETFDIDPEQVAYGGYTASMNESFDNLQLVFIIAMIAVYLILVFQFNSYIQPGLIMFTVPLAMIGVFPALYAINSSINMVSGLGIIALVGIVVNDAIVFVDFFNRLRKEHAGNVVQAIVETGRARFKPILSTSITTIFGVLPLTLTDPFWRGLGTSLMVGLACSTIGTLIVFPILLTWSDSLCRNVVKCVKKRL